MDKNKIDRSREAIRLRRIEQIQAAITLIQVLTSQIKQLDLMGEDEINQVLLDMDLEVESLDG